MPKRRTTPDSASKSASTRPHSIVRTASDKARRGSGACIGGGKEPPRPGSAPRARSTTGEGEHRGRRKRFPAGERRPPEPTAPESDFAPAPTPRPRRRRGAEPAPDRRFHQVRLRGPSHHGGRRSWNSRAASIAQGCGRDFDPCRPDCIKAGGGAAAGRSGSPAEAANGGIGSGDFVSYVEVRGSWNAPSGVAGTAA